MWWIFSLVALGGLFMAFERFMFLHKGKIRSSDFVMGIVNLIKKNRMVEALTLCEETPGPVAAIAKTALLNFRKSQSEFQVALQSAAAAEIPLLERRVNTMLFLSRLMQLLGLLGAVFAMQEPFFALKMAGSVLSTQAFAGATLAGLKFIGAGLTFSIVFYAFYHILNGRVRALVAEMERTAIELQSQLHAVTGV